MHVGSSRKGRARGLYSLRSFSNFTNSALAAAITCLRSPLPSLPSGAYGRQRVAFSFARFSPPSPRPP